MLASATSPPDNRSRFFVNTVTSQKRSSVSRPTNQRNDKLYSSCSINIRSLRIEYKTWSNSARNNCSGASGGRTTRLRVQAAERPIQPRQRPIRHLARRAKRMIKRNSRLRRHIAEHR